MPVLGTSGNGETTGSGSCEVVGGIKEDIFGEDVSNRNDNHVVRSTIVSTIIEPMSHELIVCCLGLVSIYLYCCC